MNKIIDLPDNLIGKEDQEKLESFAGHTIGRGRAVRWRWERTADGGFAIGIYRSNNSEMTDVYLFRDRESDSFGARDATGQTIASGSLERMLAQLEAYLARLHGELPEGPA